MKLFDREFDYVFSLGEDCACASYLNWHRLRVESSPFDWLTRASFATRINLLEDGFFGFLRRENMRHIQKPTEGYRDETCDYYSDDGTDFYFYHDFPAGVALDDSFPVVKEKYQRRVERLLKRLENIGQILMVWWSRDKHLSDAELLDALGRLQCRYPQAKLSLLAFEQSTDVRRVDRISPTVVRVVDRICPDVNVTWGDRRVCDRYFKAVRVVYKSRWKDICRRVLYGLAWLLAKFHLSKKARKDSCEAWVRRLGVERRQLVGGCDA